MSKEGFFVEVSHRPRRVAFLVDVEQSPEALFDAIVDFNVSSWGGRYNPIVPVLDGQITEAYWRFLRLVDPDLLYAYCDLASGVPEKILSELRPLNVFRHRRPPLKGQDRFDVRIDRQATTLPLLAGMRERVPLFMRKPEPALLGFDHKYVRGLSPFIRRNFGAAADFQAWDDSIPTMMVEPDEKEVIKALAANRNLVTAMQACAQAPRSAWALAKDWRGHVALTLCYGANPWNFVEHWNRVHFDDGIIAIGGSLGLLWMPKPLLDDPSFYKDFIEFIRRRVFVAQNQSHLQLVSYDQSAEHLREVTSRICTDFHWNMHPAEPVVRSRGDLPDFEERGIGGFFRHDLLQPQHEFVGGSGSPLQFVPPPAAPRGKDQHWIAEFGIENPREERYFANKGHWWKLPKKLGIAELFLANSACRVGRSHRICAEVSGLQQGALVNIPEKASLFRRLILPGEAPEWLRAFDPAVDIGARSLYLQASDKGKYIQGVLGLFESLRQAAFVFEDRFWREIIESLSMPRASQQTKDKVRGDLMRVGATALQSENGIDVIVEEVVDAASRIQRPKGYINFYGLFDRYWRYLAALPPEERLHELSIESSQGSPSDEKTIRTAARSNLRNMLSELISRRVFLLGAEVRCDNCLASLWYHVDDLRSVLTCRGCRKDVSLPAERPWSYAINELVSSGVRDQGIVPVIRTIYRLFEGSRECFSFLPGLEVLDYAEGAWVQLCELDLAWIRDGAFGIAEVKPAPNRFSVKENLRKILARAAPDRYLLVSASGTNEEMQEACSKVQSRLTPEIRVEGWNPDVFKSSLHPGWNTLAYSVFP